MLIRLKKALNNKGLTLMELIVTLLVLATIVTTTSAVFVPMLVTYARSNDLAEVNALLDNVAAIIMEDISHATDITIAPPPPGSGGPMFTIKNVGNIEYEIDGDGNITREIAGNPPNPLFDEGFLKNKTFNAELDHNTSTGIVELKISITEANGRWTAKREYIARPVGLMP